MEILAVASDQERAEVEEFFARAIHDPSRVRLLSETFDPHKGLPTQILYMKDPAGIVAALHAAPPVLDVRELTLLKNLPPEAAASALKHYVMLYSIATRPDQRPRGHARSLLGTMHERLKATTAAVVYGVCAADSAAFYESAGYTVRPPNQTLMLNWGGKTTAWPIEGDAQWFIREL